MMTITNFGSGEIEIADGNGRKSRLDREAANRLYQRIGFKPRETNVYRYDIPESLHSDQQ